MMKESKNSNSITKNTVFLHPVRIGDLTVSNNVWLAPLAGGSNLAFRQIAHDLGSGLVCTELVSARGIAFSGSADSSFRYLEISQAERPAAIQLFGFEAEDFQRAIHIILEDPRLQFTDAIDINMGCPVPKVVKTGAGAALMQNPAKASAIVEASRRALEGTGKPLTVKIRQGYHEHENIAAGFARQMRDSGAQLITLHARTRSQMYSGLANWSAIREVVEAVGQDIPVFGNGDVTDAASAARMFQETGCQGIMIGRAALGNPWIFSEVQARLSGRAWEEPTLTERQAVVRRHYQGLTAQVGLETGTREMRKALMEYVKFQPGAAGLRRLVASVSSPEDLERFLEAWHESGTDQFSS